MMPLRGIRGRFCSATSTQQSLGIPYVLPFYYITQSKSAQAEKLPQTLFVRFFVRLGGEWRGRLFEGLGEHLGSPEKLETHFAILQSESER